MDSQTSCTVTAVNLWLARQI